MAKYILVGGYPYKAKDGGKLICSEAIDGLSEPVNILVCLFARQQNQWDQLFEENKQFFIKNLPNTKIVFTLANEKNFINQIINSNLLYFSGGDTTELMNRLDKNPEWVKKLNGKNVIGSSAGADILSTYNYDLEFSKCSNGYGLVPVKTFVHYKSKDYIPPNGWDAAFKELKNYKRSLPILTLREGEYRTINV
jgi:peptidase E